MKCKIVFNAQGYITQIVEITKKDYTALDLQTDLNKENVWTTVHEGGELEIVASGEVIGKVLDVTNNCEYEEFEVEEIE